MRSAETEDTKLTHEQIYQRVLDDNGETSADDLAKSMGLRGHGAILQHVGKHILAHFQQTGVMLAYPKLNVPLPTIRRSRTPNLATRSSTDAKLQIGSLRLKELGDFDQVASFEVFKHDLDGDQVLVLKPISRFGVDVAVKPPRSSSKRSTKTTETPNASSTAASGSQQTTSSTAIVSAAPTETAPEIRAAVPAEAEDTGLPNTVTPASKVPVVSGTGSALDEDEGLNPQMI